MLPQLWNPHYGELCHRINGCSVLRRRDAWVLLTQTLLFFSSVNTFLGFVIFVLLVRNKKSVYLRVIACFDYFHEILNGINLVFLVSLCQYSKVIILNDFLLVSMHDIGCTVWSHIHTSQATTIFYYVWLGLRLLYTLLNFSVFRSITQPTPSTILQN